MPRSGATAQVAIDRSQINGNVFGIVADGTNGGTIRGVIKDSVVSGNSENGITAHTTGTSIWLVVDETAVSGNLYGLVAVAAVRKYSPATPRCSTIPSGSPTMAVHCIPTATTE